MVAEILRNPKNAALARPALLEGGVEPEERVVFGGLGWERYLAFDKALGDDRRSPRFYYLDGDLEVMTTSNEHDRIKTWIGDFLADYFFERRIEIMPRGQATMRILEEAGAEPDESWCVGEEKQWPDLVLEIALTSGGLRKLEIYRRFAIPEVWFWRRRKLELHALREDASGYARLDSSRLLPDFPVELLERCVANQNWQQARRAFRAGLG